MPPSCQGEREGEDADAEVPPSEVDVVPSVERGDPASVSEASSDGIEAPSRGDNKQISVWNSHW